MKKRICAAAQGGMMKPFKTWALVDEKNEGFCLTRTRDYAKHLVAKINAFGEKWKVVRVIVKEVKK